MKNINFSPIHCAEHLRLAIQIVGKSSADILALLPDKGIRIFDNYLEIPLGNITISGMLNSRMFLEKVRLFTNTDEEILYYVDFLVRNFNYSQLLDAWLYNEFLIRLDLKYESCISVESITRANV